MAESQSATLNATSYEAKPLAYFEERRPEMLPFVPPTAETVLDVGCSDGLFGESIKRRQPCEVWGVEMMPAAAENARTRLDRVFPCAFEAASLPESYFDCVIFNDCLEHLPEPEKALERTRRLLKTDGVVVASIPNMRYYPVLKDLVLHRNWEYADYGVLDRTHLRFFTCNSIRTLFARGGYVTARIEGINPYLWGSARRYKVLNALCLGALSDMRYQQFAVVAKPSAHA